MAYSTIDKSTAYFNTKTFTGTAGSGQSITGVGFRPDWLWIKHRTDVSTHRLQDSVRGSTKIIPSNDTTAESTSSDSVTSFDSDGFTHGTNSAIDSTGNVVAWSWLAGGTAPSQTYVVKVVSDSGNKYRFDDFGTSAVTLDLQEGGTYTFDQSDSSNSGHPLRFYTASDKSGGEYTTGVTTNGTPGSSGAYTRITVAASAPTLYYQCSSHAGMGGQANTNSTFGSSNFSGSIQSTVSANTTAGFSISTHTVPNVGGGSYTIGHGLGKKPKWVITKHTSTTGNWQTYFEGIGTENQQYLQLNSNAALANHSGLWGSGMTTSVVGLSNTALSAGTTAITYSFAEIPGYSKFGTYTGNGNADGSFIYTGLKPAWVLGKRIDSANNWYLFDTVRDPFNLTQRKLRPDTTAAENNNSSKAIDILSNGFKIKNSDAEFNGSGASYIYIAFGQTMVGSNNVPATAR